MSVETLLSKFRAVRRSGPVDGPLSAIPGVVAPRRLHDVLRQLNARLFRFGGTGTGVRWYPLANDGGGASEKIPISTNLR